MRKWENKRMEVKDMKRTHRIGTVTLGLILVVLGILLLLRLIFPVLDYELIFRLWPVIFVVLGIEVLVSSWKPEAQLQYDGAAIFLMVTLVVFAMCMAGLDWVFTHYPQY